MWTDPYVIVSALALVSCVAAAATDDAVAEKRDYCGAVSARLRDDALDALDGPVQFGLERKKLSPGAVRWLDLSLTFCLGSTSDALDGCRGRLHDAAAAETAELVAGALGDVSRALAGNGGCAGESSSLAR